MTAQEYPTRSISKKGQRWIEIVFVLVFLISLIGAPPAQLAQAASASPLANVAQPAQQEAVTGIEAVATDYTFSTASGTYTAISGGTALCTETGSGNCGDVVYTVPMGITYTYNGTAYTSAYVSTNGFLCFGAAPATTNYTPISGAANQCISAMGNNLRGRQASGNYGVLSYTTESSPSAFVVQYSNWQENSSQSTTYYNFQIRLYAATGVAEVKYGAYNTGSSSKTFQIGLRGASSSDYNNRMCTNCTNWAGTSPGSANTSTMTLNYPSGYYPASGLTWTWTPANTPTITVSATSLTAFSATPGVASAAQTYTVAGSNLTSNIAITAPTGFELSTDGSTYSSSLSLTQTGGTVPTTTVYARLFSAAEGSFSGNITHTSSGATQKDVAVSGSVLYVYTLSTATDGNGTITLNPSGGSYNNGTVVTVTAVPNTGYTFGSWSGDLSGSTNPTTITMDGNKSISASFVVSLCSDVSLTAAEDTWLRNSQPLQNWGGSATIQVSPYSSYPQGSLYKWDLASIPSNATINSASLSFNVTDSSAYAFSLYNMRRAWVEGTSNGVDSTTSANWNTYDGSNSWGTTGAQNTSSDRYNTNLWGATASTFGTTGSVTIPLNTSGVAVVQGWVDASLGNYGLTMQNYTGATTNDYWIVESSEATTAANRPKLNVNYCVPPSGPTITTSGTLSAFSAAPGVASAAQTYTVAGSNLTDSIYLTAPAGFELSTDGSTYFSSLELEQTGGVVPTTTIYVRMYSPTEGAFSGNITHSSAGADQKNMAASGSVLYVYTLTVNNDGHGTVTLNPSGGSYSNGTTVTLTPVPNTGYIFSSWGGANNGDIVNTAGVYTIVVDADKQVTANFAASSCSTVNLTAAEDTYLSANDVTFNNGGNTELHVDATTGTARRTTLIKWDVSSIPAGATVSSASLSLYVVNVSPLIFNLYNVRQSWVEGTSTRTASTSSANWNTYDGVNSWGTVGAASTTLDRYDTNLWGADTTTFNSTGAKTINLNASGVSVVQGWINGGLTNNGLILQNYYGTTTNAVYLSSSEATTTANRPKLNVTYCIVTTGPTITTVSSLVDFTSNIGVPSAEQSYTVTGVNLTNDITITAPTDFQISTTSGSGFGSTVTLTQSGGSVPTTPIYVRFLRATAGTSTGNITHVSSGATQVNIPVSGTASNGAPAISLVQPADNATGVSTSPTLEVTITDPDSDATNVSFYGRPVSTGPGEDFMIALIPDPQNESQYAPAMLTSMMNWVVTNKTTNNIVYVTALGDMVNTSSSTTQYDNIDAAIDLLDAGSVQYTMAPGNHDIAYGTTYYGNYFGVARYAGYLYSNGYWFGGSYNDYNTYSLFTAGGMDFILINLQYSPTTDILNWADALLTTYSTRRAIVTQHDILNTDNSWNNQASYNALRDHDNLFLMASGHMHSGSDGAAYVAGTGTGGAGQTIHIIQADYQDINSGNGYLRLLRFSPANDMIYMTTYSPYTGGSITTSPDQMDLGYDMVSSGTSTEAYTLIGTVNGVTSGTNASVVWSGLSPSTEYEWYAVADDGTTTTTSSTWSFTTGATVTHSVSLYPGWNLVSFDLHPADTAPVNVLASLAGNFDLVYAWDASGAHTGAGNWMKYDPNVPPPVNSLTSMDEKMGYWIHMTAPDILDVTGTPPTTTNISLDTTAGGWNLVGYPSATAGTLPDILRDHGVGTNYTIVFAYHVADTADPWKSFDPSVPFIADLKTLTSGWGYWIFVTANSTWAVPY